MYFTSAFVTGAAAPEILCPVLVLYRADGVITVVPYDLRIYENHLVTVAKTVSPS